MRPVLQADPNLGIRRLRAGGSVARATLRLFLHKVVQAGQRMQADVLGPRRTKAPKSHAAVVWPFIHYRGPHALVPCSRE